MKFVFIVNPSPAINRKPTRIMEWINEIWSATGIDYEIMQTTKSGDGTPLARRAVENGATVVVAVGGDGTINEVAQGIINTDTALGIVPAGSGNGFARNLRIPLKPRDAIEALKSLKFRQLDAGKINNHYFFNVAGAAFDADVTHRFARTTMRGPLPYFYAAIREYFQYTPRRVVLEFDDKKIRRAPLLLSFANLPEFGNNAMIAPNARPDDGLMDLCILSPIREFGKAVKQVPRLFDGTIDEMPEMEIYQTRKVIVKRYSDGPIHTDGEALMEKAILEVEMLPGVLKLAVGEKVI